MRLFKYFYTQKECLCLCLQGVKCWHDLDNTEYDCWPIDSPNDYNMISCGGEFSYIYLSACLIECFITAETTEL